VNRFSGIVSQGALSIATAALLLAGCGGSSGTNGLMPSPMGGGGGGNQPLSTMTINGGAAFVNGAGHAVYVFDADLASPGHSVCNAQCALNWPPIATPASALPSGWTSITRADNSMQLAHNGRPLYTFSNDTMPGQATGDGITAFGGVWHLARPAGSMGGGGGGGY
jgi:predicted lipoprotein with Yx(FWY)xxD motif